MANLVNGRFATYTTDLGTTVDNLGFKIRRDKLGVSGGIEAPAGVCLGLSRLFKPRALIGEYPDRSKIRYIVPNFTTLVAQIQVIIADGAVCVHLDGESWSFIPNTFLGNTAPNPATYAPQAPGVTLIETGSYDYTSDSLGETKGRYKMETIPAELFTAAKNCLANPVVGTAPCTISGQTTPRAISVVANRTGGGTFVRKTYPQTRGAAVVTCATAMLGVGICVRYKGESTRNIHLLTAPTP